MSYRDTPLVPDEYFHIYNRGNSKQDIFKDVGDYLRFQHLLFVANGSKSFSFRSAQRHDIFDFDRGQTLVKIAAYCLMSNHFHILLSANEEDGIQRFMQKLSTAYSMYFNIKYDRCGGLFEGKYKSKHVIDDRYLKYLYSYIHLNPVKLIRNDWKENGLGDIEQVKNYLLHYPYSSLLDYVTDADRPEKCVLDSDPLVHHDSSYDWISECIEWLSVTEV